jgi:hypothetical protein
MREGTPNSTNNFHLFRLLINVPSSQFVCCSSFSKMSNNWVAQQHNERSKKGSWKKENTKEALKCWNFERIIDTEQQDRDIPDELRLEDLLNEETGRGGNNAEDAEAEDEVASID